MNVSDVENTITDDIDAQEYRISVKVTDHESSDPLKGAIVTFTSADNPDTTFTGVTGSAGGCTVKPITGSYIVTCNCDGYDDYEDDDLVTVSGDDSLFIEMTSNGKGWFFLCQLFF